MARGGRRAGNTGQSYKNRTDLNARRTLPPQAGPSKVYGEGAALKAAQQAVPMATAPTSPAPSSGGVFDPSQIPALPSMPGLDRPTERPGEPVTTGMPVGPGAGPEAIAPVMGANPVLGAAAALNSLGENAPQQVKALRAALNATLANQGTP